MPVPRNVLPVELASCVLSASAVAKVVPRPAEVAPEWLCCLAWGVLTGMAGFETPLGDVPLPPAMTATLALRASLSFMECSRCNRNTFSRSFLSSSSLIGYSPLPAGFPSLRSRTFATIPAARVPPTPLPPAMLGPASLPTRDGGRAVDRLATARW